MGGDGKPENKHFKRTGGETLGGAGGLRSDVGDLAERTR